MAPSPFHGIFSSLGSDEDALQAFRADEQAAKKPLRTASPVQQKPARAQGIGQVAVDIFEYDNYYIIKAPLAGVKMSDLDIEINDNVITLRGVRRQADTIPDDRYYVRECFWGEFERSVTLPCAIDPKKVKATFNKECVLKVLVPKEERVKIVRIGSED